MAVEVDAKKSLHLQILFPHFVAECHQWLTLLAHRADVGKIRGGNRGARCFDQVRDLLIDHAPYDFMDGPTRGKIRVQPDNDFMLLAKQADLVQLFER